MSYNRYDMTDEEYKKYKAAETKRKRFIVGAGVVTVAIIVAIIFGISGIERIQPGYAAIVYSPRGGIQEKALTRGWQWIGPFKKATQYSIATEQGYLSKAGKEGSKDDESFMVPSKTGKTVNVDLEYSYHFELEKLPEVYTTFRGQSGETIEQAFMKGKLKAWSGEVTSKYDVLDIFGERRSEINAAVLSHLQEKFKEYGIVIDSANFSRIGLDEATEKAIQERVNAEQTLAKIATDKKVAEETALKNKIEAEGKKQVMMINAQAEAEANAKLAASVNDKLLEIKRLEALKAQYEAQAKWPVTTYIQGQGTNPIVNIPQTQTPAAK